MNSAPTIPPTIRILVAGSRQNDRRMRMTVKIGQEIRRRRLQLRLIVAGSLPDELDRVSFADEYFPLLTSVETARLILTCSLFLDTVPADESRTAFSVICQAAGMPILAHATSPVEGRTDLLSVREWSADAFIEAIETAPLWTPCKDAIRTIIGSLDETTAFD